jgi:uncharacterized membrane protein (UPF0127 family)
MSDQLQAPVGPKTILVRDIAVPVEVATTSEEQQRGLSGRAKLEHDSGMLFDFHNDTHQRIRNFWMIDMQFNIDIIWIRNGNIIGIEKNVPKPEANTPPSQLPRYPSPDVVDYVLEVNAGWSDEHNILVGDTITLQ